MAAPRKYPDESRARAVRLVLDAKGRRGRRQGRGLADRGAVGDQPRDVAGLGPPRPKSTREPGGHDDQ
jgi:hypothetical protein